MKMMPACSTRSTRRARHLVHVDQLLLFFLRQRIRAPRARAACASSCAPEQAGQHVLEVDVDSSTDDPAMISNDGNAFLAHVDLDDAIVEPARRAAARAAFRASAAPARGSRRAADRRTAAPRRQRRQQQIEQRSSAVCAALSRTSARAPRAPCRPRARRGRAPSTRRRGRRSRPR